MAVNPRSWRTQQIKRSWNEFRSYSKCLFNFVLLLNYFSLLFWIWLNNHAWTFCSVLTEKIHFFKHFFNASELDVKKHHLKSWNVPEWSEGRMWSSGRVRYCSRTTGTLVPDSTASDSRLSQENTFSFLIKKSAFFIRSLNLYNLFKTFLTSCVVFQKTRNVQDWQD